MVAFIAFAVKYKSILIPIGVALAVLLFLFGIYQKGKWDAHKDAAVAAAEADKKLQLQADRAQAAADARAKTDAATITSNANAREGAINAHPDATPNDATVAFNCERLRQSGIDTSKVRACIVPRPASQAQAVH